VAAKCQIRGIVMDYPGVPTLVILLLVFLVLSCRQTDRQTEAPEWHDRCMAYSRDYLSRAINSHILVVP